MNQLLPIIRRKRRPLLPVEDVKAARENAHPTDTMNAELPKKENGTDATDATDGERKVSHAKTSITR
jgi:hypothetical protein